MQAITYSEYGSADVLRQIEKPRPTPNAGDVLIEVVATGLNAADWRLMSADPMLVRLEMGLFKPKQTTPGADVAGRVIAVGDGVTTFQIGDAVFGDLAGAGFGGLAEYVCVSAEILTLIPDGISFVEAAAVPMAAVTALQALRDFGEVQAGDHVLISGASGGVGTYAVQLAKQMGATVTAVTSPNKLAQARALGADHTIDYTRHDFTENSGQYDVIVSISGHYPLRHHRRALTPTGRLALVSSKTSQLLAAAMSRAKSIRVVMAKPNPADLAYIANLLATKQVRPIIDRCYPLTESAEAIRYLAAGRASGKVIVTVRDPQRKQS